MGILQPSVLINCVLIKNKKCKHHNADDNRKQKTDKQVRIQLEKLWTNQRSATREPVVTVRERILYEARVPGDGTMLI